MAAPILVYCDSSEVTPSQISNVSVNGTLMSTSYALVLFDEGSITVEYENVPIITVDNASSGDMYKLNLPSAEKVS